MAGYLPKSNGCCLFSILHDINLNETALITSVYLNEKSGFSILPMRCRRRRSTR
ncbi:hypothetical protein D1AOALGA4SA_5924 [Olavius algarvensis Delta 1 endosymbiont]|nr:hypothetical protein D1AOALGA4SA_5924 [Olavius algarvensis Delta 1 endosymbiont]